MRTACRRHYSQYHCIRVKYASLVHREIGSRSVSSVYACVCVLSYLGSDDFLVDFLFFSLFRTFDELDRIGMALEEARVVVVEVIVMAD